MIQWDLESYFSFIGDHQRARAYEFAGLPTMLRRGMEALHGQKRMFMTKEGKTYGPGLFNFSIMGSSESCSDAILVTSELCGALKQSGRGFVLPSDDNSQDVRCPGMMVVDDLITISGGGMSAADCVKDAEAICDIVAACATRYGLFFHCDAVAKDSKTLAYINLFDELGHKIDVPISLFAVTKSGKVRIPQLPEDEAHTDLGMEVHNDHRLTQIATFNAVSKTIRSRAEYLISSELPCQAQLCSKCQCDGQS